MSERFTIVYDPKLATYDLGENHPLKAERYTLTMSLLSALGWLDDPGVVMETPDAAGLTELLLVHSYPYVQAVQQGQAIARGQRPHADLGLYGLGTSDDPLFPDLHDAAALYTGATIQAMNALLENRAVHAYSPAGGQHHAQRAMASGFCVYNDCAAALAVALKAGRRVAYVDFDAHHGDGVQAAFYDEPRALTISVHESGEYLFPGTGDCEETGAGEGKGACLNVPLPPMAGDEAILAAFDRVIAPALRAYSPDIVVTQMGVDTHHADPLTHLTGTLALFPQLATRLHALVHECSEGRWLITGGGGYDPFDVAPRAWTVFIGTVLGHKTSGVPLPEEWLRASRAAGGDPPGGLLQDPGPGYIPLP
ncbi:MAG: acetoin utilization protein AcuC, partial [Thermoleophilia bacterium]|nr:acetoin utilization protein AcuC [Thermoleophilia bacterium]